MSTGAALDQAIERSLAPIPEVRLAYVFGSRARGDHRDASDLDVAVLYVRTLDAWAREQARRRVVVALTDELGGIGERADIVDFAHCDAGVGFDAIRNGRAVFTRDEVERTELEVRIGRRYDDEAPKRALFRRAARGLAHDPSER